MCVCEYPHGFQLRLLDPKFGQEQRPGNMVAKLQVGMDPSNLKGPGFQRSTELSEVKSRVFAS